MSENINEKKHEHEDDCCCCEHEEHEHEEHEHEEDDCCCCGHDHEREDHDHEEHEHHEHEHHHEHHHHDDEEEDDCCCCGHDHEHEEHEHEEHEHHEHEHHHHEHHHHDDEEEDDCCCGHDHAHEHHHHEHEHHSHEIKGATTVFLLENLGCANCAAKMEKQICDLPQVEDASITFATKQLRVKANDAKSLLPKLQEICSSIESEVVVTLRDDTKKKEAQTTEAKESGLFDKIKEKKEVLTLIIGAILFFATVIVKQLSGAEEYSIPMIVVFVIAYLILGADVLLTALRNMGKGQIFDENFLMSIATLGAFAIAEYPEAVGVMLFFRVGELFEDIAVERSRSQIMEAVDLRPEVVNLVDGDETRTIPAGEANVGDLVLVRPGDRIPLDGIVVEGTSRIDTSAVTGEPVPVKAEPGNEVISGCVNTSGLLKVRVEKRLEESMVSRILDSVENAAASKPKIDTFITRFARVYTPVVVAIAIFTAVAIPLITGQEFYPWVYMALSFLVMSCPCALVLSVPLAFFCGIGSGSKRGILFKGGIAIEAIAGVKAVVMDKTGTITKGNFVVQQIVSAGTMKEEEMLALAAACESRSTHPIAESIVKEAQRRNIAFDRTAQLTEISGKGIQSQIDGKDVLCGNRKLMDHFGIDCSSFTPDTEGAEVLLAVDGTFCGSFVIADTIKEEAKDAISHIKNQGVRTAMLTGDAEGSAQAVAKKTGVDQVYARLLPEEKVEKLVEIRKTCGSVMFVGDGINDAPVLAGADVGAAMGSGADAAIEAADVVFMNSNLDAIPQSFAIARRTAAISKQNVIFALTIKIAVMILGLTGIYANMWLAVFADTGVAMLCILNSVRILYTKIGEN